MQGPVGPLEMFAGTTGQMTGEQMQAMQMQLFLQQQQFMQQQLMMHAMWQPPPSRPESVASGLTGMMSVSAPAARQPKAAAPGTLTQGRSEAQSSSEISGVMVTEDDI